MFVKFFEGIFGNHKRNGEVEKAKAKAREDADTLVGAYLDEFESQAHKLITARQQKILGFTPSDPVDDAEFTVKVPEPATIPTDTAKSADKPKRLKTKA